MFSSRKSHEPQLGWRGPQVMIDMYNLRPMIFSLLTKFLNFLFVNNYLVNHKHSYFLGKDYCPSLQQLSANVFRESTSSYLCPQQRNKWLSIHRNKLSFLESQNNTKLSAAFIRNQVKRCGCGITGWALRSLLIWHARIKTRHIWASGEWESVDGGCVCSKWAINK